MFDRLMLDKWILNGWDELPWILVSGFVAYAAILLYTRLVGLRSFSKMSAPDFAMTVAVGSLFASTVALSTPSLVVGLTAIATLYLGQWVLARLRVAGVWFAGVVDNEPLLLMAGSSILHDHLKQANVTLADLHAKLREANVLNYDQVRAVVFETTGDVSVLHSDDRETPLEPAIFGDVLQRESLFPGAGDD